MLKLHNVHQGGKNANIYMKLVNLLASTTWQAVLYTEDNDVNTDNDDDATQLH